MQEIRKVRQRAINSLLPTFQKVARDFHHGGLHEDKNKAKHGSELNQRLAFDLVEGRCALVARLRPVVTPALSRKRFARVGDGVPL